MGLVLSSRIGFSSLRNPRRICILPSSGTIWRASSSRPTAPRSTSCITHVTVMSLVADATQVKVSPANALEPASKSILPAEPEYRTSTK